MIGVMILIPVTITVSAVRRTIAVVVLAIIADFIGSRVDVRIGIVQITAAWNSIVTIFIAVHQTIAVTAVFAAISIIVETIRATQFPVCAPSVRGTGILSARVSVVAVHRSPLACAVHAAVVLRAEVSVVTRMAGVYVRMPALNTGGIAVILGAGIAVAAIEFLTRGCELKSIRRQDDIDHEKHIQNIDGAVPVAIGRTEFFLGRIDSSQNEIDSPDGVNDIDTAVTVDVAFRPDGFQRLGRGEVCHATLRDGHAQNRDVFPHQVPP